MANKWVFIFVITKIAKKKNKKKLVYLLKNKYAAGIKKVFFLNEKNICETIEPFFN